MAEQAGEKAQVHYVRNDGTDGWQVWLGARHMGWVLKADDPAKKHRAWGYKTICTTRWPHGRRCMEGFGTRAEAGAALLRDDAHTGALTGSRDGSDA